ncbi:MAG: zinc transporter ZupT [Armatimonadetes bacterium]|nr:zinc transporter ZupT [Armatimonadota bacterium]
MPNVWLALGLTLFAGMATGIGSVIAFAAHRTNYRFLSVAAGFSAGVMLYVSFVEIFPEGTRALISAYGPRLGHWLNAGSFFAGMLLIGIIDNLIPAAENPHETHAQAQRDILHDPSVSTSPAAGAGHSHHSASAANGHLHRMGLFTAIAIGIHNFPEGLATFVAALEDPKLGVAIAVAVALHNIPEGISVSVPIYYATGNRAKAFYYSVLSGLAEPVGAIIGYLILILFSGTTDGQIPAALMGTLFGGIAGIMVYISLDELLPTSRAYGQGHDSLYGLVAGMVVMSLSLLLTK